MNHGIIRILTDLVASSRYLPSILWEAPSRVVPHKASSRGLGCPWGSSPCGLPWVSGVVPPQLVPERFVSVVQHRFEFVRAGANKAEQSNSWFDHRDELPSSCEPSPSSMNRRRAACAITEQCNPSTGCHKGVRSSSSETKISPQWTKCAYLEYDHEKRK